MTKEMYVSFNFVVETEDDSDEFKNELNAIDHLKAMIANLSEDDLRSCVEIYDIEDKDKD